MTFRYAQQAFSLVEMAIVLAIFGVVLASLLMPLQAQRDQLAQNQTESTLELAKKALMGFAQANGRLPCPATDTSNGMEQPLGGGICTLQIGFLPAATLGIQPTTDGFAIDGWNNNLRYAVTTSNGSAYTTSSGISNTGMANLTPDLRVCNSALATTGITTSSCSALPEQNYTINNAVAVIFSLGPTGGQTIGGVDETENLNALANVDTVFVSHGVTSANFNAGEFDHIVAWISPFVLYNAMIESGQLH